MRNEDDDNLRELMDRIRYVIARAKTGSLRLSDDGLKRLADALEEEAEALRITVIG